LRVRAKCIGSWLSMVISTHALPWQLFTMIRMWLSIVIAKSAIELALMFTLGRVLLGALIGQRRAGNVVWQVLDIAARPVLRLARAASPKIVQDRHIPLVAIIWLIVLWVVVLKLKIGTCLVAGTNICR
jgi:hypothetical protein